MTVIALARDVHSPGKEIGAAIAAHLGIDYVDRKMLLGLVAGSAGLDVETIERLVTGGASLFDRWMISQHRISRLTVSQIVRLAAKDNQLIEDCGATALLRLVRHVICIGIRPCAARMPVYALDPAAAKSLHLKGPMRCDSETITGLCDLVIDPNRDSVAQCVEVVARLVQSPRFLPTEESLARITWSAELTPSRTWPGSNVQVGQQIIGLEDVTCSEHAIARIEQHLHGSGTVVASRPKWPPSGLLG